MTTLSIQRLETILNTVPELLYKIDEAMFSFKTSADKWSKKEILGHLIDSATNNHQRFIRGQFEDIPNISYDQNEWNKLNHYKEMESKHVINFWIVYNEHLLKIIKQIPNEKLQNKCCKKDGSTNTIQFLIDDYVSHLEHHLSQIVNT